MCRTEREEKNAEDSHERLMQQSQARWLESIDS